LILTSCILLWKQPFIVWHNKLHEPATFKPEQRTPTHDASNNTRYAALCSTTKTTKTQGWEFAGPTTYVNQFGNGPKLASAAAVQNVVSTTAADGTAAWFLGSVNGGVWRSTSNLHTGENVHWTNVLDGQPVTCSSISALRASSSSPTTIYAGCGGSTSSEQGSDWNVVNSGDWGGIMVSTDAGRTWKMIESFPENYYVTDILEINSQTILVAAQSHLWDRTDGGIWRTNDGGKTFHQVSCIPTFTLTPNVNDSHLWDTSGAITPVVNNRRNASANLILATHGHSSNVTASLSTDGGKTFLNLPLAWTKGAVPFYTCATTLMNGELVIGGLTRLPGGLPNNTDSEIFVFQERVGEWRKLKQPTRMDEDSMPKDRMALLGDPEYGDLLYVAGNAGALAWRVNVTTDSWTKLWDAPDVIDGSIPHGDCRNYAWDNGRLLLVSDGGIFARIKPREEGGKWISLNGDYSGLELISAHYDPNDGRYVMGAQDNCAIVTKMNSTPLNVGFGFVEGDGTVTTVDSQASPSRLFGTTQFLGVGTIENDPTSKRTATTSTADSGDDDDDDNDDCGGLCFAQGDNFIQIDVETYFPEASSFPFFVQPYTLNRQDPTLLHFWANASASRPSAFYQFSIPYSVKGKDDIEAPTKLQENPSGAMIMDFVSGGYTDGKADPNLLLGISNTHLYVRSLIDQGLNSTMVERSLPVSFAAPVTLEYDNFNIGVRILGPLTHARTVSMAVSPSDSRIVAVTGWPSVDNNSGDEVIFVTMDAGKTWHNITGNLRTASGVSGKVRPSGMLLLDLPLQEDGRLTLALLVGTSNGIFVSFLSEDLVTATREPDHQKWTRLGTCKEFPIVLTADIDYEPTSDRLVAATYGRGIYILKGAKKKLLQVGNSIIENSDSEVVASTAL